MILKVPFSVLIIYNLIPKLQSYLLYSYYPFILDFKNALQPTVLIKHSLKSQVEKFNLAPHLGKHDTTTQA